jgi:glycosyltransferase involved in cell wall biosynthesis
MRSLPRLRLAMISYGLPVEGQKRGGIERAAHTLADGLVRRGHEVVVFSHDRKPDTAAYEVRELPWKAFVNTWAGRRLTMGYLGNLLALMPDYDTFDAVIAHGDSLLISLSGKPVLRVMHGSALGEARSATSAGRSVLQLGVYAQELLTALVSRGVVGVSGNTLRYNPFVSHVIPHGVDENLFAPWPRTRTPEPSMLFVGALDGRKRGQFLLQRFVDTIRPAHPTASLTMVCPSGPSHPGVRYVNGVSDRELATLYRQAWIYASPSTYEGFGLPYLEAMACGTPVVASPNPGSIEVLGGGGGVMPNDEDFATAIVTLLGDEAQRARLSEAALQRAHEFSLTKMFDEYERLLFELTGFHVKSVASA